ncbi:MBL fold metallo-hydrolase [Brevibacterium aurantiacum]|uniref:MBL fold metallo-hydrolase n=1 Tax=Brevibacterium aurantiacum TaxID=273384 RepID=A0A2A3Z2V7_BREAU|nr:MBL fold metallo-hydrolase [Brevibacterium aurantiacum]PCC45849.1 MBL fold metallo-hydrolase [Brevibacterium aurantiacum]
MRTPQNPTNDFSDAIPSWTVGNIVVHRIDEAPLPPATGTWLFPDVTERVIAQARWLEPDFADASGIVHIDSHSFALETEGVRVVIDTAIGNGKERANPAWNGLNTDYLQRLTAAGFPPETVNLVILTHLHTDHVGWNTVEANGSWVPTFPNARYLVARIEHEFWAGYDMDAARRQMFRDSVHPIERAGLLDAIDVPTNGIEVAAGVRLVPTPGHTPGHTSVQLSSHGKRALITGDCIHHPVQLARPEICSCVDIDPPRAQSTRKHLLAELADTETLLLGTHFPPPTAGKVVECGDTYQLKSVTPTNRN